MNNNIKIAKELIRIAKNLVANDSLKEKISLNTDDTHAFKFKNITMSNEVGDNFTDEVIITNDLVVFDYEKDLNNQFTNSQELSNIILNNIKNIIENVLFNNEEIQSIDYKNINIDQSKNQFSIEGLKIKTMELFAESLYYDLEEKHLV